MKGKINRNDFLKIILSAISISFIWILSRVVNFKNENKLSQIEITEPGNGITVFDDFIIIKNAEKILVLSSKCPHSGCRINKIENDIIICPCHGSQFNNKGELLKGPAYKNLQKLPFTRKNNKLIINI